MSDIEIKYYSTWILNKLHKSKDEIVKGISFGETDRLVDSLRSRLSLTETDLDLSPKSLKQLGVSLKHYYLNEIKDIRLLPENQIMEIIKEIVAYFGKTIIKNTDGKWINLGTLIRTEIEIPGPIKVQKGRRKFQQDSSIILLSNAATTLWDNIVIGFEMPEMLYKDFQKIKKKNFR